MTPKVLSVTRLRRVSHDTILERTNFAAVYASLPGNLTVSQNLRVGKRKLDRRGRSIVFPGPKLYPADVLRTG